MGLMPSGAGNPFTKLDKQKRDWCAQGDGIARPRRAPRSEESIVDRAQAFEIARNDIDGGRSVLYNYRDSRHRGYSLRDLWLVCWSFGKKNIAAVEEVTPSTWGLPRLMLRRPESTVTTPL